MTTFSDSDEITGNDLVTSQSIEDEEMDSAELADELLAMEEEDDVDGGEIKENIRDIEDDIEALESDEEVAINGEVKKIENELNAEQEKLDDAEGDLEDEVAGFVGE